MCGDLRGYRMGNAEVNVGPLNPCRCCGSEAQQWPQLRILLNPELGRWEEEGSRAVSAHAAK